MFPSSASGPNRDNRLLIAAVKKQQDAEFPWQTVSQAEALWEPKSQIVG
jgi:hypothetical protein